MIRAFLAAVVGAVLASLAPLHARPHHVRSFDCELPHEPIPLPAAVGMT